MQKQAGMIAVVDYGMGNLRSVWQALLKVADGKQVVVTDKPETIALAERVVFPGQGAMPDCMKELDARSLRPAILEASQNKPFLGICIGMQMLFEMSEEGHTPGLGILPGKVCRFPEKMQDEHGNKLKVPHMGWNTVKQVAPHPIWKGIDDPAFFYFVHSYHASLKASDLIIGQTNYKDPFTSCVAQDNIVGIQCHPEKSAAVGLQLLHNFVHWNP